MTLVKELIRSLAHPAKRFYTEEEEQGDRRLGFRMRTLEGKSGYPAEGRVIIPDEIGHLMGQERPAP
jgi:nucleoside-triphosphatase THEP1